MLSCLCRQREALADAVEVASGWKPASTLEFLLRAVRKADQSLSSVAPCCTANFAAEMRFDLFEFSIDLMY